MAIQNHTYYVYNTPMGRLTIASDGTAITNIAFGIVQLSGTCVPTTLTNRASTQLLEYLAGKRRSFDLPLNPQGTSFQKQVWDAVSQIPYGETRSYLDIATALGNPKATRAIGAANNKNPLPIVVPCHRVIGVNGKLMGYAGGPKIKQFLIDLEATHVGK